MEALVALLKVGKKALLISNYEQLAVLLEEVRWPQAFLEEVRRAQALLGKIPPRILEWPAANARPTGSN